MSNFSPQQFPRDFLVPEGVDARLDAFLADCCSEYSRAILRRAIDAGHVLVDGEIRKPSYKLSGGEKVVVAQVESPRAGPEPEAIPLELLFEDEHMVAVNKPAGMIVHPAKGHWAGTLASALAYHFGDELSGAGGPSRPGIVHRLDRDTSGVIVVAKHDAAHHALAAQFKERTTEKEYLAIVRGVPDRDADVIDKPIGPHPRIREQMAIRPDQPDARPAQTRWEVVERFARFALLRCLPKTGRTHQIRVHLAHDGYPILCDKLYGGSSQTTVSELQGLQAGGEAPACEPVLTRQALHARRLAINHPASGARLEIEAPVPADIAAALECLRSG